MKLSIVFYKDEFEITQEEIEDYFRWWWLPEPEIKGRGAKKAVERRLERLRKMVAWIKRISDKYNKQFSYCKTWSVNATNRKVTILA